jgi:hypothetical protein
VKGGKWMVRVCFAFFLRVMERGGGSSQRKIDRPEQFATVPSRGLYIISHFFAHIRTTDNFCDTKLRIIIILFHHTIIVLDPASTISTDLILLKMNTMRIAPMAKVLAFSRTPQFARKQFRFGVSAMRMMSAAPPGPKVSIKSSNIAQLHTLL